MKTIVYWFLISIEKLILFPFLCVIFIMPLIELCVNILDNTLGRWIEKFKPCKHLHKTSWPIEYNGTRAYECRDCKHSWIGI